MSSTEELAEFYADQLVPLAEQLRHRGVVFFSRGADDCATWYEEAPTEPEFAEHHDDALVTALRARWAGEGLPELAALAPAFGRLAEQLRRPAEQHGSDVSDFVYVMY